MDSPWPSNLNFDIDMSFNSEFAWDDNLVLDDTSIIPFPNSNTNFDDPTPDSAFATLLLGESLQPVASQEPYNFIEPVEDEGQDTVSSERNPHITAQLTLVPPSATPQPAISKRRRRRPGGPILEGPNKFGRGGVPRCQWCRKWRQKCIYDVEDEACTVCKLKGLECGRKLWGEERETRISSQPERALLRVNRPFGPSEEVIYEDRILSAFCRPTSNFFLDTGDFRFTRFDFTLYHVPWDLVESSKCLRYAVIALGCSLLGSGDTRRDHHKLVSLNRSCCFLRCSLSQPPTIDLFYTCLALLRYAYRSFWLGVDPDFQPVYIHLSGIFGIARALKSQNTGIPNREIEEIEHQQLRTITSAERSIVSWGRYGIIRRSGTTELGQLKKILEPDFEIVSRQSTVTKSHLRLGLGMLSVFINHEFRRLMENQIFVTETVPQADWNSEISTLLVFVREFKILLTAADSRVLDFVGSCCTDDELQAVFLADNNNFENYSNFFTFCSRLESYIFVSFLECVLTSSEIEVEDPKLNFIRFICVGLAKFRSRWHLIHGNWMILWDEVYSLTVARLILMAALFPERELPGHILLIQERAAINRRVAEVLRPQDWWTVFLSDAFLKRVEDCSSWFEILKLQESDLYLWECFGRGPLFYLSHKEEYEEVV